MPPHGVIDTAYFSEKARKDLLHLLENVPGKKNLVLAKPLVGAVESLVKFSTLQEYGVDRVFFLENENVDSSQRNIIFLASGEKVRQAQTIATQIKKLRHVSPTQHEFSVFWTPRRTLVCGKILEEAGVLGDVSSLEFPLLFQPLEPDLLSMEMTETFSDLYLRRDPTTIFLAAKALMLIQQRHGLFPRIIGKGDNAKRLADLLIRLRSEPFAGEYSAAAGITSPGLMPSTSIESIIIIDRDVDFASVLLTQLTYEGLIDEMFGISHSQTELDSSIVGAAPNPQSQGSSSGDVQPSQPQQGLKRKIKLDSSDKLYEQLRDANFATVGSLLNKVARRLQTDFDGRHGNKTTSELREFVAKLPGYQAEQQSLKIHTSLAEEVMKQTRSDLFSRSLEIQQNMIAGTNPTPLHDTIEELIARDCPLPTVLRLLCLESCMTNGLRPKDFDSFKRQIVQAYGYQHVMTLAALEKMQLLQPSGPGGFYIPGTGSGSTAEGTRTNYSAVRKPLQLIVEEVNEQDPTDIAYTYSGYAPLSVRLVQCVLQKQYLTPQTKANAAGAPAEGPQGWRGFENVLKNVKGETFEREQMGTDKSSRARQVLNGHAEKKTTIVFFLGGSSFAEIAALRLVARQEGGRRRVLICTTGILSGERMMRAAIERSGVGKV